MHRFACIPLAAQEPLLDGKTLDCWEYDPTIWLPALTSKSAGRPATVMHGGNGIFAIRSGPWKPVKNDGSEKNATVKGRHDFRLNDMVRLIAESPRMTNR